MDIRMPIPKARLTADKAHQLSLNPLRAKLNVVCSSSLKLLANRLTSARPAPIRRCGSRDVLRSYQLVLQPLDPLRCSSLDEPAQCFFSRSTCIRHSNSGNHLRFSLVLTTLCHISLDILSKSLFTSRSTSIRPFISRDNLLLRSPSFPTPGSIHRSSIYQLIRRLSVAHTPQSVANTPVIEYSPAFSCFNCSTPSDNSPSIHQLIAELEETVAYLHRQYNDARRCVHTMTQWHVFPYAKSLSDEAKKAKEELDQVMKKIAAVDTECSELEALLRDEHEKLEEVEEALKKAYWHREGINEEHALLQDEVHELQAGQPVNGVWQHRAGEPLQQDYTPSHSVAEQARGSSLAASESSRLEKKTVNSWDSQWESLIAQQRYSLPRSVQAVEAVTMSEQEDSRLESDGGRGATRAALDHTQRMTPGKPGKKASRRVTTQVPVDASNESGRRTNNARVRDAHQADTSDYFGRPLRWGQLAPSSPVRARKSDTRSSKHA